MAIGEVYPKSSWDQSLLASWTSVITAVQAMMEAHSASPNVQWWARDALHHLSFNANCAANIVAEGKAQAVTAFLRRAKAAFPADRCINSFVDRSLSAVVRVTPTVPYH